MCKYTFTCVLTQTCAFPHLDAVIHLHVSQQFAVNTEETKLSLVVVNHAVALSGGLDEAGPQAALWALQGPQQVPIHGMDQTRTLCTQIRQNDKSSSKCSMCSCCYQVSECLVAVKYKLYTTKYIFGHNHAERLQTILPLQPLMTRPSSAHTLAHVTSQSWPVKMARGVVNSAGKTQT